MQSAQINAFTRRIEDIHLVDAPIPQPGPGQVRVRMLLSPVNPSDLNFVHGTYHTALQRIIWNQGSQEGDAVCYDPAHQVTCPVPPYSLGGEGVGIVDATGSGFLAKRLAGKRVAIAGGPPYGTWQEYTLADAKKAVPLPDAISNEQGAMYFVNPVTAYVLVREVLKVKPGSWLLITAAGSALGKSMVRMGKIYGFKTLCVVRSAGNSAELRHLGADAIVQTNEQDLLAEVARITGGKGVASAVDCVGGELTAQVVRCLGLDGKLVLYGTLADSPMELPIRDLMMPVAHISGFVLPNWMLQQSPIKLLGVLRAVKKLMLKGAFTTEIETTYPLDKVVDAVNAALQPGRIGKILLQISAP
jgi:NADPH:quinone reductase-like Zn-dependent oxidoreductase